MFPADVFRSTLIRLIAILERFGIRYHLTGGVAAVAYGEPRLTQDLDLVIDPVATSRCRDELLAALLEAGFHLVEATARAAIDERGMFQILDIDEALKFDLYAESSIPGELDRSVIVELLPGLKVPIVSRADAALSKLIWAGKGSSKSRVDLRRILERASAGEAATVRRSAAERGLLGLLEQILHESEPP